MRRVHVIVRHPVFADRLTQLEALEKERTFCRHGLPHLLDVARIMWIAVLERQLPLDRDVVYAAALLHDIGRVEQLQQGIPHHLASGDLAARILPEAGFSPEETCQIIQAIRGHRTGGNDDTLGRLLHWADKASRTCWRCDASSACNWPEEKKNPDIIR